MKKALLLFLLAPSILWASAVNPGPVPESTGQLAVQPTDSLDYLVNKVVAGYNVIVTTTTGPSGAAIKITGTASGGGSGGVLPGTAGQAAYYSVTASSVTGTDLFQVYPSSAVFPLGFQTSSTTYNDKTVFTSTAATGNAIATLQGQTAALAVSSGSLLTTTNALATSSGSLATSITNLQTSTGTLLATNNALSISTSALATSSGTQAGLITALTTNTNGRGTVGPGIAGQPLVYATSGSSGTGYSGMGMFGSSTTMTLPVNISSGATITNVSSVTYLGGYYYYSSENIGKINISTSSTGLGYSVPITTGNIGSNGLNSCGYVVGTIVQSSTSYDGSSTSNGGTSYSATGLHVGLTPKCASDLITLYASGNIEVNASGHYGGATIYNGASTDLAPVAGTFLTYTAGGVSVMVPAFMVATHLPNSTSAQTYTVEIKCADAGFTTYWNNGNQGTMMRAEEIAQ